MEELCGLELVPRGAVGSVAFEDGNDASDDAPAAVGLFEYDLSHRLYEVEVGGLLLCWGVYCCDHMFVLSRRSTIRVQTSIGGALGLVERMDLKGCLPQSSPLPGRDGLIVSYLTVVVGVLRAGLMHLVRCCKMLCVGRTGNPR